MARPKRDPLIAAMIAKLPDAGEWPVERQLSWLHLMAMAFGTVYGGDAAAQLRHDDISRVRQSAAAMTAALPKPASPASPAYPFYIDTDNRAKDKSGKPVKASEVKGELFDLRGWDGDMKLIEWADGSTGLNGANLTIVAV